MAELQTIELPLPVGGLELDAVGSAVPNDKAPVLENWLLDRPGKLIPRGYHSVIDAFAGWTLNPDDRFFAAPWVHGDNLLLPASAGNNTGPPVRQRQPWVAPYRRASGETIFNTPSATMVHKNLSTGTTTYVATGAVPYQTPGPRHARFGAYVYGPAYYAGTAIAAHDGGYIAQTNLLRWDGTTTPPVILTNAPRGCQDVRDHNERLWCGGAFAPGSVVYEPNTLFFSDPGWDGTDTVENWQDDVSLLTNRIVLDDNLNDFIVGLAVVNRNLVVFRRHSIFLITGYSSDTYAARKLTRFGCVDPRSICEASDGVYFASEAGIIFFDGSEWTNVSRGINSAVVPKIDQYVGNAGADGGFVTLGELPKGYIGLNIGATSLATAFGAVDARAFSAIYDTTNRAWSTVWGAEPAIMDTHPLLWARLPNHWIALGRRALGSAAFVTSPENQTADNVGYDLSAAGARVDARPKWRTKVIRLGSPTTRAELHALILEYVLATGSATGLTLTGYQQDGSTVASAINLTIHAIGSTGIYEHVEDNFEEANDLQLEITRAAATDAVRRAELRGLTLMVQLSHRRRTG